jgi:type III restriction enzyme
MVEELLRVEKADSPIEVVVHVNMLKEGWDVTNLYTIVPLRAANARTLVEQSIGRGLRLPYGERIGLTAVDRLNIVAHDRFQEIVDDANRPDSPLRVQAVEIPAEELQRRPVTVESHSILAERLGVAAKPVCLWTDSRRRRRRHRSSCRPRSALWQRQPSWPLRHSRAGPQICRARHSCADPKSRLASLRPSRPATSSSSPWNGVREPVDVERVVATVCAEVAEATIDIPRVLVVPIGKVESGFSPFTLDLSSVRYQPCN